MHRYGMTLSLILRNNQDVMANRTLTDKALSRYRGDTPKEILNGGKELNYGQWKNIGMNWAQCCRDVLEGAERKWITPRENRLATDGWRTKQVNGCARWLRE